MSVLVAWGVVLLLGASPETGSSTEPCPFDGAKITTPVPLVGEQTGLRLDLRPVGGFVHPAPLSRCPRCQYVSGMHLDEEQLTKVRAVVSSKAYRAQARHPSNHALRAMLLSALDAPPGEIAFEWLRASWESEGTPAWAQATEQALAAFSRLATPAQRDADLELWRTAHVMRIELLRRLARFPEAEAALDASSKFAELQRGAFVTILSVERSLIQRRQDAPQPFPSVPPFDPRDDDPAFVAARQLAGFKALDADFVIESASLGHINAEAHALKVSLQARAPRALDSIWWWNFTDGGVPRYGWPDLLAAHARAEQLVARSRWLMDWKAAGPERRIELHLFGLGAVEADFETFTQPAWSHAGFTEPPTTQLLLRENGATSCATLFFDQSGNGIITTVFGCTPNHWVTAKKFSYHPRDTPPTYLYFHADGRHEQRTTGATR